MAGESLGSRKGDGMKKILLSELRRRLRDGEAFYLPYNTLFRVRDVRQMKGKVELQTDFGGWQTRDTVREFGAIEQIQVLPMKKGGLCLTKN